MIIFKARSQSPYETLAFEEMLANDGELKEDVLFLYQHSNAVIIGKNQNAYEEIKKDYIDEYDIKLARRLSGGGAVYQDLGNICFSFITTYNKKSGYDRFLKPIIEYLNSLGLNAEFKGRNDILCNGAKISGNAQYIKGNKIVSHGTLLFDADLTKLTNALTPAKIKFESKGIKSVAKRVTNIAKELNYSITVQDFIDDLIKFFVTNYDAQYSELPVLRYKNKVQKIIERNSSRDWIYGKNPEFSVKNTKKFNGGILTVKYNVVNNIVRDIVFEGDFLSLKPLDSLTANFINLVYDKEEFDKVLSQIDLKFYFGTLEKEEILEVIFG